jgi:signal transduction histidine kinase
LRLSLDAILIGISLFLISWSVVLRALYMGSTGPAVGRVLGLVYPVGDVIILSLVAFVATRYRTEGTTPLNLIGLAMVIWSVSDSAYSYLSFKGMYFPGHPVEVGWVAGFVLLIVAALRARPVEAEEEPRSRLPRVHLPYVVAGVSFLIGVATQIARGTQDPVVVYGLLGLSLLVLARQFSAIVEHQRFTIRQMEELDQLKTTFLMAISHELRTPLTSVVGYASLLDGALSDFSPEEAGQFVHAINVSGQRLEHLLSDLLDIERMDRGALALKRRETDLRELVRRVLEYSGMDGRVQATIAKDTLAHVDPAIVERIVENLVVNAVKHTPADTNIYVLAESFGTSLVLTVEDDGPGIPDDVKAAIFEPFRKSAPTHRPGTGVGLTLVAQFAKLHGGSAWVEDRPGGGSRFRVHLEDSVVAPTPSDTELRMLAG